MKRELRVLEARGHAIWNARWPRRRPNSQRLAAEQEEAHARSSQEATAQNVEAGKSVVAATVRARSGARGTGAAGHGTRRVPERDRAAAASKRKPRSSGPTRIAAERRATIEAREAAQMASAQKLGDHRHVCDKTARRNTEDLAARRAEKAAVGRAVRGRGGDCRAHRRGAQRTGCARRHCSRSKTRRPGEQRELARQNEETRTASGVAASRAPAPGRYAWPNSRRNGTRRERARPKWTTALRSSRQTLSDLREERGHHEVEQARNRCRAGAPARGVLRTS